MAILKNIKKNFPQVMVFCLVFLASCSVSRLIREGTNDRRLVSESTVNDFKKNYSSEELLLIDLDLKNIRVTSFLGKMGECAHPIYVTTAGGPGSCKSTILENYLYDKLNFVYVDPDQRTLKYMVNTYHQSLTNREISKKPLAYGELLKDAYFKWRGASNYIANTILNEAFDGGYNIAHGATSTSNAIRSLYTKLKQKKYKIVLLLCYASDETRSSAIDHRLNVQSFVQVTSEDFINKAMWFPTRFPTYFEFADEMQFYWTEDFLKGSVLAATYQKGKDLVIHNQEALDCFIKKYDEDRKATPGLQSLAELVALHRTGK